MKQKKMKIRKQNDVDFFNLSFYNILEILSFVQIEFDYRNDTSLIEKLFGWFKLDRFKKPFLIFKCIKITTQIQMPVTKILNCLYSLDLSRTKVGNEECQYLGNVHTLVLSETEVRDEGCRYLSNVHTLDLCGTKVGDKGCRYLSNVHTLNLRSTDVGDEGCRHLSKVHTLNLSFTKVGDEGCQYLSKVHNLDLSFTKVCGVPYSKIKNI